jgi:methyl coenzyme M reductase beta subunit
MEEHISAAETELQDRFTEDLHSAGTLPNQIGGLQLAIPTVTTAGTYGGIARSNTVWQTKTYDAHTAFAAIIPSTPATSQVTAANIKAMFDYIMITHSRGTKGPNLILSSASHYTAYTAATVAIQRINDESTLGQTAIL